MSKITKRLMFTPLLFLAVFSVACQTSSKTKIDNLDKVQVGMDKAQVIDTVGFGPALSERKSGQDRWIFEVYPDRDGSVTVDKEVRFQDGKVVYVGAVQKPAVSAAEQDKLNATAKNDNLNIEDSLKRENRKQSVDLKEELSNSMPKKPYFEEVVPVEDKAAQ